MTLAGGTFAGIPEAFAQFEHADIVLQGIPYDGTSTWGKGANNGFKAFLSAAENMELYDIETDTEVYRRGVHILPEISLGETPEDMFGAVLDHARKIIRTGKFPTFFGGEHSISIGIIKAFYEYYENLTVLQIDAHADLRPSYGGTPYNHACAVYDASKHANLVQVGIRSMDVEERVHCNFDHCFFMHDLIGNPHWIDRVVAKLSPQVYITLDLDAFDPSIMPATGTPEPGGLGWYPMLSLLKSVFAKSTVVGFDIVELAPIPGNPAPDFLAAKLYYKMLTYKFMHHA